MQTTLDWNAPLSWGLLLALVVLLVVQGWFITRNAGLSGTRRAVRLGLNLLLWLVLLAYVLQPQWPARKPATHVLLTGDDVPTAIARRVQDSLHLRERIAPRHLTRTYDSVTLIGNRFPLATLTRLSGSTVQRVPFTAPDDLQQLHWKGMLRQGELQRVTGTVMSGENQTLRLRFGNRTLDSVAVKAGMHSFAFQFPAFARGRNQVELSLGAKTLDTLHFFTQPVSPLTIEFVLNGPDFESKTLANWLGRQGHTVLVSATLSKDISSQLSINKSASSGKATPDLLITEPTNAGNAQVRKAVADGRAVLFINLTNPDADSRTINQAVGSRWQVTRTTNAPTVPVGNGLNALPYRFADNLNQFAVTGYPVMVQQGVGRVGVSLLSETFPLALGGDSLTYNRLWTAVLARLSRPEMNVVAVNAPLIQGLSQVITVNNPTRKLPTLRVGSDTLPLTYSPLNEQSATANGRFTQAGWQAVQDTLALYVEPANGNDPLASRALIDRFMLAHAQFQSVANRQDTPSTAQLPDWAWFALLIGCFTALWLEPKLG